MVWWFVSQNVMIVFFCHAARFENRGGLMSALGQVGGRFMPSRDIPESSVSKIKIFLRIVTPLRYPFVFCSNSNSNRNSNRTGLDDWTG